MLALTQSGEHGAAIDRLSFSERFLPAARSFLAKIDHQSSLCGDRSDRYAPMTSAAVLGNCRH